MKLKEYMALCEPGTEITCWDKDVDSEFYFYTKERDKKALYSDEFPNVNKCMDRLAEVLDVVKVHDGGVEVNLYEILEHPKVIQYAKANFYEAHQYEDDADVTMLLFDDNDKNISQGFEEFSRMMVECLDQVYGEENIIENTNSDAPKIKYGDMIKFLNDNGILLMQPVIADTVDSLLPIGWDGCTDEYYEELCEKCFDAYLAFGDERDHWDIVKEVLEEEFNKEESLDDVIKTCEKVSKNGQRDVAEKGTIDKEER